MTKLETFDYSDIFTTLIDLRWRYVLFMFASVQLTSWLLFATVYLSINNIYAIYVDSPANETADVCFFAVHNFYSAFLYSVETQFTIGYGYRLVVICLCVCLEIVQTF
jgi:hypothetical protein